MSPTCETLALRPRPGARAFGPLLRGMWCAFVWGCSLRVPLSKVAVGRPGMARPRRLPGGGPLSAVGRGSRGSSIRQHAHASDDTSRTMLGQ